MDTLKGMALAIFIVIGASILLIWFTAFIKSLPDRFKKDCQEDFTPKESTEYSESLCNKTGLNYDLEKIQLVEYDLCRGVELFNHTTVRYLIDKIHRLNRDNKLLESDNSRLAILAFGNKKTLEEYQEELANVKNNKPHPWI